MQGDYTILWLAQIRKYDWLVYANIVKSLPVSKGISPQTTMKTKLFKLLFPKQYRALKEALNLSSRYYLDSPIREKREVGEDIYMRVTGILIK